MFSPGDKEAQDLESVKDPRQDIIQEALGLVTKNRNKEYGEPEDNFLNIAELWKEYMAQFHQVRPDLKPQDVALMMVLFKLARMGENINNRDNWADLIGYAACGWRCTQQEDSDG